MLTRIQIKNFKLFEDVDIELGESVVFIGPNNSGKTTALQALTLWDIGLRQWMTKRGSSNTPEKRSGVAINRRDLITIPIPSTTLLWKDTHVRSVNQFVRIDIIVEGFTNGKDWKCGLEFDYSNDESIYCRPLRIDDKKNPDRMIVPDLANRMKIAYLPPMSGLAEQEFFKQDGEIGFLLGQGQTAQVLRNLCFRIFQNDKMKWESLINELKLLFGIELQAPKYYPERSEITMDYKEASGKRLDLSSSGRGLQQTLLLLSHLYANPNSVLLLDEPDAHLEILRQRQIFNTLLKVADEQSSQIIAASHSEVVLNEATARSHVVAFIGKPHPLTDKKSQVIKALRDIGFDQYYQAEQLGWVLYLEDATDLAVLQGFAEKINHPAKQYLERPFVYNVACNQPQKARDHFWGLREGKSDLVGIAIFDRLSTELTQNDDLVELMWQKNEIENYFCIKENLIRFIEDSTTGELFQASDTDIMKEEIDELEKALLKIGKPSPWGDDIKATDDFLDPLFRNFSSRTNQPLILRKRNYYKLIKYMSKDMVDKEVITKLDSIVSVAKKAKPA